MTDYREKTLFEVLRDLNLPADCSAWNEFRILKQCRNHTLRWAWFDIVRPFRKWLPSFMCRWPDPGIQVSVCDCKLHEEPLCTEGFKPLPRYPQFCGNELPDDTICAHLKECHGVQKV